MRATLVFFDVLSGPLHGPIHNSYLGAFGVALGLAGSALLFTRQYPTTVHEISSRSESVTAVTLASVAGTWLHTTLDAIHHPDMPPFYPLPGNPLYELTSYLTFSEDVFVYGGCARISPRWRADWDLCRLEAMADNKCIAGIVLSTLRREHLLIRGVSRESPCDHPPTRNRIFKQL